MAESLAVWLSSEQDNSSKKDSDEPKNQLINHSTRKSEQLHSTEKKHTDSLSSDAQVQLHINYWSLNSQKQNRPVKRIKSGKWKFPASFLIELWCYFIYYSKYLLVKCIGVFKEDEPVIFLDVGVKFINIKEDFLNIYLPFRLKENDYDGGLGGLIVNNKDVLATVFNEDIDSLQYNDSGSQYCDVNFKNKHEDKDKIRFFTNIELHNNKGLGAGVSLDYADSGSHLKFPMRDMVVDDGKWGYFRFRLILTNSNVSRICSSFTSKDRWLLSREDYVDLLDFRINETRVLPDQISKFVSPKLINKLHFFIIREVDCDYVVSEGTYTRCRLLENEIWKHYLHTTKLHQLKNIPSMIIFQWTIDTNPNEDKNTHFSIFAKFKYTKNSVLMVLRSLFWVLLFGYVSNNIDKIIKFIKCFLENIFS